MADTFLASVQAGEVHDPEAEIHDAIRRWHAAPDDPRALHTALGMTSEEYTRWVEDPTTLSEILAQREKSTSGVSETSLTKILVDLDEVLGQWVKRFTELFGLQYEEVLARWDEQEERQWDVFSVLTVPPAQGWDRIHEAGHEFWSTIDPFPWARSLVDLCLSYAPTTVLTACAPPDEGPGHPSVYAGKAAWLGKHFPDIPHLMGVGCKSVCAHPGVLLIDDSPRNCDAFRRKGGHAILFPSVGNSLHAERDPFGYTKRCLEELFPGHGREGVL